MRRLRLHLRPRHLLLAAILLTGFALRVWHNDYGLPFVWSLDEGNHFASHAVAMFRSGLNPGYYQNPAGRLDQFNTHYVPHFRGLAFLVK